MTDEDDKKTVPFWLASPHTGRKPHYDDPAKMKEDALQYMQWVEDNPLIEKKPMMEDGKAKLIDVPRMRPATQNGIQIFLGMSVQSWRDYRNKPLFSAIISEIEGWIYDQKFTGAATGFFKENLIARDLGLSDKSEVDGSMTIEVVDSYETDNS